MKARIVFLMAALLTMTTALRAADGIGIAEVSVKPGEGADLKVSITQETKNYMGFQFDIELANGLSMVSNTISNGQNNDPVCDMEKIGTNTYRFMVYSNALKAFSNGEVLSLRVRAGSGMAYGEYLLALRNIILSDENGNTVKPASRNCKVRVVVDHLEESLSLESSVIKQGETEYVGLSIAQELEKYSGFQLDMTLPEGLSLTKGIDGQLYTVSGSQPSDLVCEVETLGSNSYRLMAYSYSLKPIKSGEVLKLHVKASSGMEPKDYSLQLSQIMLSDADGQVKKLSNRVSTIKVISGSYILTYLLNDEVYKTYEMHSGETITPEPVPTKEGYTFSGWSGEPSTMPSEDVTVTGSFTVNYYKLTYMVDGEVYKTSEAEYGTRVPPEDEPTKEGYTFSGWDGLPSSMPAHDVTVTGSFTKGSYTLTYVVNGETYKTVSYGEVYKTSEIEYGVGVVAESAPTKDGYTFSGWSEIPSSMPAHDVTVTGSFTKGSYTLTYVVNGETYKTVSYDYGENITPESEPTKEGYTFSGWSGEPSTMPAEDVTVTGSFTVNQYDLTYMVDGKTYDVVSYLYGETITPEAEPTKEGYTFSGWSWIPSKMPAEDVTIMGFFTVNKYKLTYMIDGKVYKEVEVEYGATITPEPQPEGDYVSFSWTGLPETMPAKDVTVQADYVTGINGATLNDKGQMINDKWYDLKGRRISQPKKGVNILRDGSGKRKVVVVIK